MLSFCYKVLERFHSRSQHLCKFHGTKGNVCIRKEVNSHQLAEDYFGTPTWPRTPIWPQRRHVKTLYIRHSEEKSVDSFQIRRRIILSKRCNPFSRFSALALTKSRDRNSETSEWFRISIHCPPAYFDLLRSVSSDVLI